jgi:hypothetical protein
LEDQEQWEGAYKNYNEVVIKAKNVIANQPNTPVKNELVKLAEKASMQS